MEQKEKAQFLVQQPGMKIGGGGKLGMLKKMQFDLISKYEYFYNIDKVDMDSSEWARIILFIGESGHLVQSSFGDVLYTGGFMGSQYNFKIGVFKFDITDFYYHSIIQAEAKNEK